MSLQVGDFSRRAGAACAVVVLLAATGGCARQSEVVLHQPSAPQSQRELVLRGRWTFSTVAGQRRNCLLAFPRPTGQGDARDFLLYASVPAGEGRFRVDAAAPDGVRGFLIQTVGALRGKTTLVEGTVGVRRVRFAPRLHRLDLAVRCDDGTRITGRAFVKDSATELRRFERRYAADVARLTTAASQPAGMPGGTAPRLIAPPQSAGTPD